MSGILALSLTALALPAVAPAPRAQAASSVEAANEAVEEAESEVQATAAAYDAAVAEQERLANEIDALDKKIAKLEQELPLQQERSDESCVALYKYSHSTMGIVSVLLNATSITEAINLLDNYNYVIDYNVTEMTKTANMKADLEKSRSALEKDKDDADGAAATAAQALEDAKAARQAAQAEAAAAQKAEEEAAAKAAAEAAAAATTKKEKKAAQKTATQVSEATANASTSNVDWSSDKTAFVEKWTGRIDSYLAGSPTAGCGKYYAIAAWENGVDPRWAPAISCVESSKGAACFASYNAWGYGSSGFGSWEEGINTVVAALGSSMYGGYLTQAAAQTYCPPTWQDWYNKCAAEMAKI